MQLVFCDILYLLDVAVTASCRCRISPGACSPCIVQHLHPSCSRLAVTKQGPCTDVHSIDILATALQPTKAYAQAGLSTY
jgi:hypothetical protein